MFWRNTILGLVLLFAAFMATVHAAGPAIHTPDRFSSDSSAYSDTLAAERNRQLYDSIRSKSTKRAVPRMIYHMLFVRPILDTTASGVVHDESRQLEPYAGKKIGEVHIDRKQVFEPNGNWLERAANNTHRLTRERIIRRDLLFKTGDPLDPQLIVRNKQLIRSRNYIADIDIVAESDTVDTTRVNLFITTRDSWTISADAELRSGGRTMIGLSDANILGWGNSLKIMTNFNYRDFSYGGNMVQYDIPNVLGTFYTANFTAGRDFYKSTFELDIRKEFLRTTDYEVGASYSDNKTKRYMIEEDTSRLVKVRNLDLWGGYAHDLPGIRSSIYITGRYNHRRFNLRPFVSPVLNPALHNQDALLTGLGLYREKFYTASMIYGYGRREYMASGYKAELVSGYTWGEFDDALYLGMSYKTGTFRAVGYLTAGASLGSYIDLETGMWRRSGVDVNLGWFSNLFLYRRSRIRQFLTLNYTQGWNRATGSDESIRFTKENGLQAFKEYQIGSNRMTLNTETVIFTPYQPFGFRITVFGFADCGLLGYSPNIFKNELFATFGLGIRLRNERLVFNAIQIRLGVAVGKNGLAGCDYFRISNATRIEQYRYRPTRPEIVGFQ